MDLWVEIKNLEARTLYTIDQKKPFTVLRVLPDRVVVENSENKERPIRWFEIEKSWNHLKRYGTITRTEIMDSYCSHNSAYVAAILANIRGVASDMRPIVLRLRDSSL
jgi:hypothetical protein